MCLQSADMKCSSHKKWLSRVSAAEGYNEGPVRIDTGSIVIQKHTHRPKGERQGSPAAVKQPEIQVGSHSSPWD